MAEKYPHVNKARQYARDVISGKIIACNNVKLACKRFFDDLDRTDHLFYFDKDKAEKACKIVELFNHVKGEWAGTPIILQPWQLFLVVNIFGWLKTSNKKRRFREIYIEIPRKNSKSTTIAAIGNIAFMMDGEYGAEIICGATNKKQAFIVFEMAEKMIEKSPLFKETFKVECRAQSMYCHFNNSRFEPCVGKPGDGTSPHCAIIDEYHEHDTNELYDAMKTGMGARSQPLLIEITTAGTNLISPCARQHDYAQSVLNGVLRDDSFFTVMYGIDKEDDWTDFNTWIKANPNYGVSVYEDYLRGQYLDAMNRPDKQNINRTKHLDEWLSSDSPWININSVKECIIKDLKPEDVIGKRCCLSLDLASKIDIAALTLLFWDDTSKEYWSFQKFYLPRHTVEDPGNSFYRVWESQGLLTVTPGAEIDFGLIEEEAVEWYKRYNCEVMTYDPWKATQMAQNLTKKGLNMIETRQTIQNMSEPMKELEGAVYSKRFHYDGNEMLTWMFGNVVCHVDKKENVYPNKKNPKNKIDGIVTNIMGINMAMRSSETVTPNLCFIDF